MMYSLLGMRLAVALAVGALLGLALGGNLPAVEFPQAEITNGPINLKLYLPDAKNGYYRGTRFDWSGVVASLKYKGHEYYGPWFDSVDPKVHDYGYVGTKIVASPCSAATGPVEEFQTNGTALGWDEAQVGGTFIKIGVGALRKDQGVYDYVKQYEIVDPGKWTVERHPDSVIFTQELNDPSLDYSYIYRKTVRLIEGKPEMVLEHSLKNTGRRTIQSTVYNHNFLVLDKQPAGPDFAITVPFQIHSTRAPSWDLADIRGTQVVYLKVLQGEDRMQTAIEGFDGSPKANEIRIENRRVGAGMRITGDRPLSNLNLWSIRTVLAMEPFIAMTIDPGKEFTWKMSYEYYTLPSNASPAQVAGPLTASGNPNYFKDASGAVLILNGSQTWNTLQDWGSNESRRTLDFNAFVNFLIAHGHNFTLLWRTELPKFCGFPGTTGSPPDLTVSPHPWLRTGPGNATDGALKFDLSKFDQSFFDRLRTRTQALGNAGIYAGVYLFTGEWLNIFRCSSDGYPFTGANNINGIDDGYAGGSKGIASVTMTAPNAITSFQDAYVEKVVDTLNDLPNVLWIVSEEAPPDSAWWNSHQISHIRAYESGKEHQHPIGYAALIGPGSSDRALYNSDADWVAPSVRISPATSCGNGTPACKVNINDSDHSYWEMWKDTPLQNRNYAWENFLAGNQVLFMDPYVVYYPRENRNLCVSPTSAICSGPDTRWDNFRNNLGYILRYSRKLNLAHVAPHNTLSSTEYCLAHTPSVGAEYLVYAPSGGSFTVNLSAMSGSRILTVEWFNPSTGATTAGDPIPAGSPSQAFTPPFSGDAILYLVDAAGQETSGRR